MSKTSDMKHKVALWGKVKITNALDETDYTVGKIRDIYAQIIPQNGSVTQFGNLEQSVNNVSVTHKFKIRYLSGQDITITNWLVYKNVKYEIVSFNDDFKTRDYIEIMTKVVYE